MSRSILLVIIFSAFGCSTVKGKIYRDMAIGAAVGLALGQNEEKYKNANSLMYAGSFAAGAAAISLLINDPDQEIEKIRKETLQIKSELDQVLNPTLTNQFPGTLNGKIPAKYKGLIQPGEWKIYALDQWVEDGENRMVHQDKIMELIPPSLRPVQSKIKTKESP